VIGRMSSEERQCRGPRTADVVAEGPWGAVEIRTGLGFFGIPASRPLSIAAPHQGGAAASAGTHQQLDTGSLGPLQCDPMRAPCLQPALLRLQRPALSDAITT